MNPLKFFATSAPIAPLTDPAAIKRRYTRLHWQIFWAATLGYGLFYVCRLSFNVIKKPLVDAGIFNETQLGVIGMGLFVMYAAGKLGNGFLADRSNIRRFLGIGLLVSALVNLVLGFTTSFYAFVVLWGINGWMQAIGSPACVVGLTRWFSSKDRGTFYGLWSASHNIGEAITFIATSAIVSAAGWQWGFRGAGLIGLLGVVIVLVFMRDTPESCGLPPIAVYNNESASAKEQDDKPVSYYQKQVLRNPAIWMLALASAFMYISRYAVNSWGIYFLESSKGYDILEASTVVSVSSVCGIVGTVSCGWISDRFFNSSRNVPALVCGLMNVLGLGVFLLGPANCPWLDIAAMIVFGLGIGALICLLGGMMAVDIASKKASGAALGVVGMASYAGTAIQELVSGILFNQASASSADKTDLDYSTIIWFWLGAAILSVLCTLTIWKARAKSED